MHLRAAMAVAPRCHGQRARRYSTMGLGVEKFESWDGMDSAGWAPSSVPYVIEEFIQSSEYDVSAPVRLFDL